MTKLEQQTPSLTPALQATVTTASSSYIYMLHYKPRTMLLLLNFSHPATHKFVNIFKDRSCILLLEFVVSGVDVLFATQTELKMM